MFIPFVRRAALPGASALLFCIHTSAVIAHPVMYPGNVMPMAEISQKMQDVNAVWTFAPNRAVSAGYMGIESDSGNRERRITNLHYNHRIARWNMPEAQANIYLQAGIGSATGSDFSGRKLTAMPGLQADYETRHLYFAYRWHGLYSGAFSQAYNNVQAGFAMHAAEYNEISSWAILDVRRMSNFDSRTEITPTLRLIRKNTFFEFGVSTRGDPRLNVMVNF